MNRAFIFPGQGSQTIGMGKDFFNTIPKAKDVFQEIDDTLGRKLSDIIFLGPIEDLTLTTNAQPALMATSIAILRSIIEQSGKKLQDICSIVAGHSLGEYSALCASEALSLVDTTTLLNTRSKAMQDSCKENTGSMVACLGIDIEELEDIMSQLSSLNLVCEIANDNVKGQIVVSGHNEKIDELISALKDRGKKAIKLKVSAPFHCSLMKPAEEKMKQALSLIKIGEPVVPVIANVTANITMKDEIKNNLVAQICGRVRWRETMDKFSALRIDEIVEIGPGKALSGLVKKTSHNFSIRNISNISEFEEFMNSL